MKADSDTVDFSDRVYVVTGAARGLGKATAMLLAERGAAVLIVDNGSKAGGEEGDR